jgi:hypothetical protein
MVSKRQRNRIASRNTGARAVDRESEKGCCLDREAGTLAALSAASPTASLPSVPAHGMSSPVCASKTVIPSAADSTPARLAFLVTRCRFGSPPLWIQHGQRRVPRGTHASRSLPRVRPAGDATAATGAPLPPRRLEGLTRGANESRWLLLIRRWPTRDAGHRRARKRGTCLGEGRSAGVELPACSDASPAHAAPGLA